MKNKKKVTPVIETLQAEGDAKIRASKTVGVFKKLLSEFPDDAELELDGIINIHGGIELEDGPGTVSITAEYPVKPQDCYSENDEVCDECECTESMDKRDYEDIVMDKHLFGIGYKNDLFNTQIREVNTEFLTEAPIMMPSREELNLENIDLSPRQNATIDEIRHHNAYVAECMGELHRREIAALLEYQTQCMARFGFETNKTMCDIVMAHEDEIIETITDIIKGE